MTSKPVQQQLHKQTALAFLRAAALACLCAAGLAQAQPAKPAEYTPQVGQDGKDVIWVPTPPMIIERMLRMTQVTPRDLVVDLGSGDGRVAIAAARDFGARSRGLEFNPDMVTLSKREATRAGVADRVSFEEADIFKTDFSNATVVTMYLLPNLNLQLRPTLLKMKPGTRIASHQFDMGDWEPDETADLAGRQTHFWLVPAEVAGTWKVRTTAASAAGAREFDLALKQTFQKISGTHAVANGRSGLREPRLRADQIRFALVDDKGALHEFEGTVAGTKITGHVRSGTGKPAPFEATRTGD
jgi:SAM-dependent methyltransferase